MQTAYTHDSGNSEYPEVCILDKIELMQRVSKHVEYMPLKIRSVKMLHVQGRGRHLSQGDFDILKALMY